jgi:hypothetical protein
LGQFLTIALKLKRYPWQKLKPKKTQNLNRVTTNKQVGSVALEVRVTNVAIDNHMAAIQV